MRLGIRLPTAHARPPGSLSNDQLHRLADALPAEYQPIVFVSSILGLRWSEVAGLRVGSIDSLRRTLTIEAVVRGRLMLAPPKSRASVRTLTVPPGLVEMLAEHLAVVGRSRPDELVFTAPDCGPLGVRTSGYGCGDQRSRRRGSRRLRGASTTW